MDIENKLGLKYPIYWNLAAIEQDFAVRLIFKIVTTRPEVIVEIGAGNSTLITLKTLKNLGIKHKVYSIDADEWFLNETKNLLKAEGLYDPENIELIHAPLKKVKINGKMHLWHDLSRQKWEFNKIDLLTVDGPLGSLTKEARYPAVPYFKDYLKAGSSIILDDFDRPDERAIVTKWLTDNKYLEFVYRGPSSRGQAEMILHDKNRPAIYKDIPPMHIHNHDPIYEKISLILTELQDISRSKKPLITNKIKNLKQKLRNK